MASVVLQSVSRGGGAAAFSRRAALIARPRLVTARTAPPRSATARELSCATALARRPVPIPRLFRGVSRMAAPLRGAEGHQCQHVRHYTPTRVSTYYPLISRTPTWLKTLHAAVALLIATGIPALAYAHTDEVLVTRRKRVMIVPRWYDTYIGSKMWAHMHADESIEFLDDDDDRTKLVRDVGGVIANAVIKLGVAYEWEFVVQDTEEVNAFCLPGGKVIVTTGFLEHAESLHEKGLLGEGVNARDALGFVMSHEIAHALARHTAEDLTVLPLEVALASVGPLFNKAMQLLINLPRSRRSEQEADAIGLAIVSKCCEFNPAAAPGILANLSGVSGPLAVLKYVGTHPSDDERAEAARAAMPTVLSHWSDRCSKIHGKELAVRRPLFKM